MVKHLPTMRVTRVQSLGRKDPLEKQMAPHSNTLAWKIPMSLVRVTQMRISCWGELTEKSMKYQI